MLPTVHIRKEALFAMIWSTFEVFKKECLGFVLGYRPTAKRRRLNTEVEWTRRTKRRFQRFRELINPMFPKHLGDFHSHPEWGDCKPLVIMSDFDIEQFIKNGYDLEFIIGISSRRKGQVFWEIQADGSLKGSFNSFNFHFNVYALVNDNSNLKPERLQIVAPEAIKALNRIQLKY